MVGLWHCQGMARASDHRPQPASPPAAAATPSPARQGSIRDANLALLYRLIVDAPAPLSRAALAATTGMTRATASALADALLAARLVEEVSPPPATGAGRPAAGLVPAASGPVGLGLEINVDYLAACVVDLTGTVRHSLTLHGDQRGRRPEEILADLAGLARKVSDAPLTIAGTAVAVPGLVEGPHGRIRRAPNLVWQDVEIEQGLRELLPHTPFDPVVGNEADFAALAEAQAAGRPRAGSDGRRPALGDAAAADGPEAAQSAGRSRTGSEGQAVLAGSNVSAPAARQGAPLTDFLYVSGEIGVGAGIVLGGELFRGARGWAGEIGHVTVEPDGVRCRGGAHGCLETVAGLEALMRSGPEAAAGALGRAVATAVNLLDLPAVVLGGVYARPEFAGVLLPAVEATLAQHVVSAGWAPVAVHVSWLGETAAAQGAAVAVVRRIHADPAGWVEVLTRS
ncbi:MAG: ROK family protein [Catenulispora sp.]|nr:ROK family protein [Catenulispora sp.]